MFFFKPKIPVWVNFGGSCKRKSWYILRAFGLFYGHWKYFMAIWYILQSFGIFFPVLVRKIWQPCVRADFQDNPNSLPIESVKISPHGVTTGLGSQPNVSVRARVTR
jgi:hypothetical protein